MMTLTKLMILIVSMSTMKNSNPVKMSLLLLILSSLLFLLMSVEKSNVWMPLIFYMLFMGGILIMFMILSSTNPNEPSKKIKILTIPMIFLSISMFMFINNFEETGMLMIKSMLNSSFTTTSVILIILTYFFCFIWILTKKKNTLRSTICQKEKMLCKYKQKIDNKNFTKSSKFN